MKNKPVCAVLGSSGFLGTGAVPVLQERYEVRGTSMRPRAGCLSLDLREPAAVHAFLDAHRPDAVILMAAYREPDFCEEYPDEARRLNTEPARTLVKALPDGVPLVLVSTDYVFDGTRPPYRETDPRNPLSVYGRTKAEAEDAVLARPGSVVLRVPLLMGWTERFDQSGFFSQLILDLKSTETRRLDHVLKRYPVWTRDVGTALVTLLEARASGIFHFSTRQPMTRYQSAVAMAELVGWPTRHLEPSHTVIPRKARRPDDAHLDSTRWLELGYPPPHEFSDVARRFLEHFGVLPAAR